MSADSVVGQAEHSVTHLSDWTDPANWGSNPFAMGLAPAVALGAAGLDKILPHGSKPDVQAAPPQPSASEATQTALQNQLNQELTMRASRTYFPSANGTNNQPATASRVLLGT